MDSEKKTYKESIKELEKIVATLENETHIDIDEMKKQVKKATALLEFCKKELYEFDKEMEKILSKIEST